MYSLQHFICSFHFQQWSNSRKLLYFFLGISFGGVCSRLVDFDYKENSVEKTITFEIGKIL